MRLHIDSHADRLAASVGARAVTIDRDIYFDRCAYAPESRAGRWLIAHEWAHAVLHAYAGKMFRWCGPVGYALVPRTCDFVTRVPAGHRFFYDTNCDEPSAGQRARMEWYAKHVVPPGAKVCITGLASSAGDANFNRSLACRRASAAAAIFAATEVTVASEKATVPVRGSGDSTVHGVVVEIVDVPTTAPKP